jgi:hypothetical protein
MHADGRGSLSGSTTSQPDGKRNNLLGRSRAGLGVTASA